MLVGKGRSARVDTRSLRFTTVKYLSYGRNIVQQPFQLEKRQQGHDDPVDGAPCRALRQRAALAAIATEGHVTLHDLKVA
jgi:hypothetical protein